MNAPRARLPVPTGLWLTGLVASLWCLGWAIVFAIDLHDDVGGFERLADAVAVGFGLVVLVLVLLRAWRFRRTGGAELHVRPGTARPGQPLEVHLRLPPQALQAPCVMGVRVVYRNARSAEAGGRAAEDRLPTERAMVVRRESGHWELSTRLRLPDRLPGDDTGARTWIVQVLGARHEVIAQAPLAVRTSGAT